MRRTLDRRRGGIVVMATLLAMLASPAAEGHSFPPVRTVVVQAESCEVVLLVGYRPGTGEASEAVLARAVGQPKSRGLPALQAMMTQQALAPLAIAVDGKPLVPTAVRTKIGVEPGGARPMIVVLITYALPHGAALSVTSKDPRTTRISWTDRASGVFDNDRSPSQGKWFEGVASFLLPMGPTHGAHTCGPSSLPGSPRSSLSQRSP